MVEGVGWKGAGRCEGPAPPPSPRHLRVEQVPLLQPQIPHVAQGANKLVKPGMGFGCVGEKNSSLCAIYQHVTKGGGLRAPMSGGVAAGSWNKAA